MISHDASCCCFLSFFLLFFFLSIFRLQDFTLRIQENSEGSYVKILSHSYLKLANIEEKINAVIALLDQIQT